MSIPTMLFSLHRFELVDSTNDTAIRMAEDGAPEGTVVIASEQVAGRGRHRRAWSSPPGEGLYLSIILRPDIHFDQLWQLAFVAAVAVAEAVAEVSGLSPRIKWPNDVLLNGRKVCGILVESARGEWVKGREGEREILGGNVQLPTGRAVVVGIGINMNNQSFPSEIADKATSIMLETGSPVSPKRVEESLLARLDAVYADYIAHGFEPILRIWKSLDCTAGRRVSVITDDGVAYGTAQEVDSNGDLILLRDDGQTVRVTAGEVVFREG